MHFVSVSTTGTSDEATIADANMTITADGKVGIGVTPSTLLTLSANLNNSVTFARDIDTIGALVHGVGTAGAEMWLHRDDVTIGDGNLLGKLNFSGADGGSYVGASILAQASGSWSASNAKTRLMFSTTSDGDTSPTEKLRIADNGSLDFKAYGVGSFKGNALYGLGVDSSGNVVETSGTYFGTNTSNGTNPATGSGSGA